METFSALLALCAGNPPVTGEFPAQRPVTRGFDIFFDLIPNKRLSKQARCWWFETPSGPLWRHCNVNPIWSALHVDHFYKAYSIVSRLESLTPAGQLLYIINADDGNLCNSFSEYIDYPYSSDCVFSTIWDISRMAYIVGSLVAQTVGCWWASTGPLSDLWYCTVGRREHTGRETVYWWVACACYLGINVHLLKLHVVIDDILVGEVFLLDVCVFGFHIMRNTIIKM